MFIDANKIIELIEVCQDVKSRMSEENHRIHVDDIAATLQKLLDDEAARLDKMAKDFEDEEYGQAVMENAAIEKELIMDFNWPGAI